MRNSFSGSKRVDNYFGSQKVMEGSLLNSQSNCQWRGNLFSNRGGNDSTVVTKTNLSPPKTNTQRTHPERSFFGFIHPLL